MKNILIFICSLMIFGCSDSYLDNVYTDRAINHTVYYNDEFNSLHSINDILVYMESEKFQYKNDFTDFWKNPEDTFISKSGDCEDFCILFMDICKVSLNIETTLILVNATEFFSIYNRGIVSGGSVSHALVNLNGRLFDLNVNAEVGEYSYYMEAIGYEYSFSEIFN